VSRLGSKNFSEDQIAEHQRIRDQLQKANAHAGQRLRVLCALNADHTRARHVYAELANVVRWMNLLLGCCEQIADNALQQRFTRINVIIGITCEYCEENAPSADRSAGQGYLGTLRVDPAWSQHVEFLLSLTTSTIYRTCAASLSELKEPPGCLADLARALGRQQRYLERVSVRQTPEIRVIHDDNEICSECGHRKGG
jgi:hypothetical protein